MILFSFETITNVNAEGIVSHELEELAAGKISFQSILRAVQQLTLCFLFILGAQYSFNVTVKPKLFGIYESTRARIKYATGVEIEDVEPEYKQGYSTSLGRIRIISAAENARNNDNFIKQWLTFGLLYAVPTLVPFLLWQKAKAAAK